MTTATTIERAILRDREQRLAKTAEATIATATCFRCGKPFAYRGPRGDDSGRFCSDPCRIEYDVPGAFRFDPFKISRWRVVAGGDPGYLVATPMTGVSGGGFRVECRGCGQPFESRGWAYCSRTCKRESAERDGVKALMAEVGIDAPVKRKCACGCGRDISNWKNGRRVSKAVRFLDDKHAARARQRAKRSQSSFQHVRHGETSKKCSQNGPSKAAA